MNGMERRRKEMKDRKGDKERRKESSEEEK